MTSLRKKPESLRVGSCGLFFDFEGRDVLAAVVRVNVPGKSLATACVTTEEELGFICVVALVMSGTWASSREFDVVETLTISFNIS